VRFLRHLAAVVLLVAAIVLLALGWNHVAGGTVGAVRQGRGAQIVMIRPRAGYGGSRNTSWPGARIGDHLVPADGPRAELDA
jgi:hypothetical protein